jgi:hypothetical protein
MLETLSNIRTCISNVKCLLTGLQRSLSSEGGVDKQQNTAMWVRSSLQLGFMHQVGNYFYLDYAEATLGLEASREKFSPETLQIYKIFILIKDSL